MTKLEALKESVCEKMYSQEPLAEAIMSYLNKTDPAAHREILDIFDKIISNRIDTMISDELENEKGIPKLPL